jgi:hypothetical protein
VALRDIKIRKTEIATPDGAFAVRGLSYADISTLASRFKDTAEQAFKTLTQTPGTGDGGELTVGDVTPVATILLKDAPALAAAIIATAADEPDMEEVVMKLPFTLQTEALEAVGKHTFETEGSLKKAVETVIGLLQSGTRAIESLR